MASLPFLLFSLFLSLVASNNAHSSSSIASQQSKFWSQNVDNNMPDSILSKLSPLSESESETFTPLVSKNHFTSTPKFCTSANLVCASAVKPIPCVLYKQVHFTDKVSVPIEDADPWSFFRLSVLRKGNKVTLPDLGNKFPNRAFLPSNIATRIPLNDRELKRIFPTALSIPLTKAAVDMSLHHCHAPTVKGERRRCLTTLEDMVEFSRDNLGRKHLVALTSENTKGVGNQVVVVGNVVKPYKTTEKIVACHELFFPFATYYCHMLPLTQVYAVDVVSPKTRGKIFAICHMDTSSWTPNHVAFKLLKTSPGKGEVCHWIGEMDLLWIGYDD